MNGRFLSWLRGGPTPKKDHSKRDKAPGATPSGQLVFISPSVTAPVRETPAAQAEVSSESIQQGQNPNEDPFAGLLEPFPVARPRAPNRADGGGLGGGGRG